MARFWLWLSLVLLPVIGAPMSKKASLIALAIGFSFACTDSPVMPIPTPSTYPILFSSNRSFGEFMPSDVYKMRSDGTDSVNLTKNPANDIDPSWSPDGKSVAFASNRNGSYDIFVMNDDGSSTRQLTNDAADDTQPRWSPDGKKLVYTSKKDGGAISTTDRFTTDLFVINADGSNQVNLTVTPRSDENSAAWSPDGKRILYGRQEYTTDGFRTGGGGLFLVNSDGTGATLFTLVGTQFGAGAAAWSPDGTKVAVAALYNNHPQGFVQTVIVIANADGTNVIPITPLNTTLLFNFPAWSPDGKQIIFTMVDNAESWGRVGGGREYDVGVINTDGTGFKNLTPESPRPGSVFEDAVTGGPQVWRQ
jgi:Tol biopolymer transport system component